MSRWYRTYADAERNPKVAVLTDREFRLWHRLLGVAAENDGRIPPLAALKALLNARSDHLLTGLERLISIGLIDRCENHYEPHNWGKRQYKSDTSVERVAKHRKKVQANVTAPETDTEAEAETEKKNPQKKARESPEVSPPDGAGGGLCLWPIGEPPDGGEGALAEIGEKYSGPFEQFWMAYPNKTGKRRAFQAYQLAFKRLGGAKAGANRIHELLLIAVGHQVVAWRRKRVEGKYIPHASTWLNRSGWEDGDVKLLMNAAPRPPDEPVVFMTPAAPKREGALTFGRAGWSPTDDEIG